MVSSEVTVITALSIFLIPFGITNVSFATVQIDGNASSDQVPNFSASSIFDTHKMVIGNNIKNLVILIPNEGHHGHKWMKIGSWISRLSLKTQF